MIGTGLFGCGILGGCGPTCPDGAAAQQASADYWRRQQESMFNAWPAQSPEEQAEWDRLFATRRHVEALRAEHGPDWLFWGFFLPMAVGVALRWWIR